MALTVGAIDEGTLVQKGQIPFVGRRPSCPRSASCSWASGWTTRSSRAARARPAERRADRLASDEELLAAYRRAAVYVQASRHEGFGLAVAEAMLAGCVPVVMDVTAMPEVVGDAGVLIASQDPAGGGRRGPAGARARARGGRRARERILTAFPLHRRGEGLLRVVGEASEPA